VQIADYKLGCVAADEPRPRLDTSVAYSARVNNYWQGGKDNFAADREAGEQALDAFPDLPLAVRAGIKLRTRAIRFLVQEAGVRQFLDLGTGLPSGDPVHRIAQSLDSQCRVVYVDHDPMVISHAQALSHSAPEGACGYVEDDVRDTGTVLAAAKQTLDFGQPVVVFMSSLLHLIPDDDDAYPMVAAYLDAVVPGSYLLITHPSSDIHPQQAAQMASRLNNLMVQKRKYRNQAEVARFFTGLEFVEPGLVPVPKWRPESEMEARSPTMVWCAIGRKS
jgi:S-adenosyl methyltransferase